MRYLKKIITSGVYEYIPLEASMFDFIETDEHEYRIELFVGKIGMTLFEKIYIPDVDIFMNNIASIADGTIITIEDLI
jgi:hypothetical protein